MPFKTRKSLILQIVMLASLGLFVACSSGDKSGSSDAGGMGNIANQLRARGDDAGAAEFYQRSLQSNPNDVSARIGLAEIYEAHGDNQNALQNYNEAARLAPDDIDPHRDMGRLYIKMNRPAEAKDEYQKALAIDSDDIKSMNGLGVALDFMGNHDAAQKEYKAALDEKSDDMTTLNNLAHSYVMVGSYDQAIKLLEPHVKDKTATPALRQNLAEAYGMAGMNADAERVARMDLNPDQVKRNLGYYQSRRAQLSLVPKLYADLGSFPTEAMADGRLDDVNAVLGKDADGLIINVTSEVKAINGTPSFSLRATGFARAEKVKAFCDRLKKSDIDCKAHF